MQIQERAYRPIEAVQHRVLAGAFAWMSAGLGLTGLIAFATAQSPALLELIHGNRLVFWGLILAELGLVFTLAGAVQRLGSAAGTGMFLLFSALNGLYTSISQLDKFAPRTAPTDTVDQLEQTRNV